MNKTNDVCLGFYSVNDIMKLFDIKRRTVLKLIHQNKIKGFKIGKQWRISKIEFDRFIETEQNKYN